MKRAMILFAKGFPYNVSEPFLESEYPHYKNYFEHVLIVTGCKKGEKATRIVDDSIVELLNDYTLSKDLKCIVEALPMMLVDPLFYKEIGLLIKSRRFSLKRFGQLVTISLCGNHRALLAKRWMKKHPEYNVNVIYSYWLQITAYATVRLKMLTKRNDIFAVSRAHGFDLYEERMKTKYLPFQKQLIEKIDEIALISLNGKKYLENKYGETHNISICHLGALDRGFLNPLVSRNKIQIVSCSRVVPVKRVHCIVEALMKIKDISVEWTHIGGGELLDNIKEMAEKLPDNIKVDFTGTVSNKEVYDLYKRKPFHVFLNVSKSEGVPVSIMEAMSFGIPVIATDVGGTAELVDENQNGFLLKEDFAIQNLCETIYRYYEMPEKEYAIFRENARRKFKAEYDAQSNYAAFVEKIAKKGEEYEKNSHNYNT